MKVIGINASPRKGKTTFYVLNKAFTEIKNIHPEIESEIIELGGLNISGCRDCGYCKKELSCSIKDDFINIIPALADRNIKGIIIATPVYLGGMTALCKAFIERTVMFRRNGFLFRDMAGGVIALGGVRNGGQELAIQSVQAGLLCHDMIVVGDGNDTAHYGGACWSGGEGGIENDLAGYKTAFNTVKRVCDIMKRINK